MAVNHPNTGALLRRLRSERNLSQEALARMAGVSGQTIQNAEASRRLFPSTILLLMQALHEHTPVPLDDLQWLASRAGMSERSMIALHQSAYPREHKARDLQLHARLDELLEVADPTWVAGILDALNTVARARSSALSSSRLIDVSRVPPAPAGGRRMIVRGPPVERHGLTEELEVEYEVREPQPKPAAKPKAQRRPAAG